MSITATFKKHVAELPFGEYQARLESIDEIESKRQADTGDDFDPLCWLWSFTITQAPYEGVSVSGISSRIYSIKSKSYEWARNLGHPGSGADFDADLIFGKPCMLKVDVDETETGSTYNKILKVLPPVKAQMAA